MVLGKYLSNKVRKNFNLRACITMQHVALFERYLAVPHFQVDDFSHINPQRLYEHGCRRVFFDHENTLTVPGSYDIFPGLEDVFAKYKRRFGEDNILVYSNFAGAEPDRIKNCYEEAEKLEDSLGVRVIRHRYKKPEFDPCMNEFSEVDLEYAVMIGDRLNDVIFGNRYHMLTVLTTPLTDEENIFDGPARIIESLMLQRLQKRWTAPPQIMLNPKSYHSILYGNVSVLEQLGIYWPEEGFQQDVTRSSARRQI
jgi:HAD superfamily phosphatase (TIGR01668 family)